MHAGKRQGNAIEQGQQPGPPVARFPHHHPIKMKLPACDLGVGGMGTERQGGQSRPHTTAAALAGACNIRQKPGNISSPSDISNDFAFL